MRHAEIERQLMDRLRQVFGGRDWLVAGEVAQGIVGGVVDLRSLGAADVIAIASRSAVGPLPDDVRIIMSDGARVGAHASMIEMMHDNNRELHDLPGWVVALVDEWDPERQARAIVSFTIDAGLVAGRPTFGARSPEWAELEDKIAILDLWDTAGVTTAPDHVVSLSDLDQVISAHDAVATPYGTVWATDNEQGWHGGGAGTHWVASREQAVELAVELATRHSQVRVQPFLEGVPCSIHGMVLRDATLTFRPCEMIVLLDTEANTFEYARAATFWDPDPLARQEMRDAAGAIGDALRGSVDYRGVFTVDGVLTADGFRPTEVNPRFGAALPRRVPLPGGSELPLWFAHLAAVEGELDDLDSADLEALIVDGLDRHRRGAAFINTDRGPGVEQQRVNIAGTWTGQKMTELRAAPEDDSATFATATWGDNAAGGLVIVAFTDALPTGPPVAPTVVAVRSFLDERWHLNLRTLQPAFAG